MIFFKVPVYLAEKAELSRLNLAVVPYLSILAFLKIFCLFNSVSPLGWGWKGMIWFWPLFTGILFLVRGGWEGCWASGEMWEFINAIESAQWLPEEPWPGALDSPPAPPLDHWLAYSHLTWRKRQLAQKGQTCSSAQPGCHLQVPEWGHPGCNYLPWHSGS